MVLGGRVVKAQPLVGVDRDEITQLVSRIREADEKLRHVRTQEASAPVKTEDLRLAEEWKLPGEMFDYFEIERV